jgi:tetratricopeptide (TPR) repeat protein/tRNA A-37 threonylcarbamoyl transferase component Bud32
VTEASLSALELGRVIAGRYHVEQVLGRGGMGAVYRVKDERSGAVVALKRGFARDPRKAASRQALLEREYHTLAQLAHPRIIEVYDYGVDERGPYYTMELLDGCDLGEQSRMPWREACAVLCDVASSLAILHSRGLVHRDVSTRNVRRTADGRAKLIDFGTMMSMGVAKELVGTPAFMAPEALQMQTLDARADLFSLGALGYYLLTGRHAYPARRMSELRDVWRSPPVPPMRLLSDLPAPLSTLIVQLLALDRGARPQSAAEVMNRLGAIAGLPAEEQAAVSRAYLTTPVLVGRDRALLAVRKRMLSLARGDGGTLVIEGVAGSGRSRLLDACALEGKLLGATVVRADASDGEREAWGVAHALGVQLFELMPKEAAEAARLSRDVLSHVFDGLLGEASAVMPERSLLIRELRDFMLSLARVQRLLVVVDDADRIDEPSAALLAALALKTERHPLLVAVAVERDAEQASPASLSLVSSLSVPITLEPLLPEETEALLRSVFGDVPNLPLCAARIHALAQGSPRATIELAQHLVDRGLARYETGRFSLPGELDDGDPLPHTLSGSLGSRLARLGADARELAQALALADGDAPSLACYAELTSHRDARRVFSALDELVSARVLAVDGERYRFSQRGFVQVLRDATPPAQAAALHARIGDLLARTGADVLRRAHHLFEAQRDIEAIELLTSINLLERLPELPLLERAVASAEQHGLPARTIHHLRMAVLSKAPFVLGWDAFKRCLPHVLERLERESGLSRYQELVDVPENERLQQALLQTQQRFIVTPDHERVYAVGDAIRELARLNGAVCSMAASIFDLELLESLPSLEPLRPLSPAVTLVSLIVDAGKLWIAGRAQQARAMYEQVLERIARPDRSGLDEVQYARTRYGIHYSLGLTEAMLGIEAAERHAQVLEADRELRVNAWRVRQLLKLAQGDIDEARHCGRRAELLQVQEGIEPRYLHSGAGFEMFIAFMSGDVLGMRNTLKTLERLSACFPGWRLPKLVAEIRYRQMQGDLQGALELVLANLDGVRPGRHTFYCHFVAAHVDLLRELGRLSEAVEAAERYLQICVREELSGPSQQVYSTAAQAWARAGQHARAVATMDQVVEAAERLGSSGLVLGALLEARARIAIWMDDREAFEKYAKRCAAEFNKGHCTVLSVKFQRLLDEARQGEVADLQLDPQMLDLITGTGTESEYETVESRMRECVDRGDRSRCALTMLLQRMDSFAGYLFGVTESGLVLLSGLPERMPEDGMRRWLDTIVGVELAVEADVTATATGEDDASDSSDPMRAPGFTDADGRPFQALPLSAYDDSGQRRLVAVLAYHAPPGPRTLPDRRFVTHLASELYGQGDAGGIVVGAGEGKRH